MSLSKKAYKGCRDFFPTQMKTRNFLFDQMRKTASLYGYEPYDGPLLEETALYKAKSGEELINEQIYSFTDRGNREVAIRPEMTPTLARMVSNIHKETSKPIRWYSIPNLLRYEKPQRGRVREHWQYNVDVFGSPENLGEVEILNFAVDFLRGFGATNEMFSILLNDRIVVDAVFNTLLELDTDSSYKLYKVIDKAKKVTSEKLDTMIREIITDDNKVSLFKKYLGLKSFDDLEGFLKENSLIENCMSFMNFVSIIKELNFFSFIQYDPTIVRGLDYYTGVVFEIFDKHPDNNRAIAGGGAYANLLQIFNEAPMSGVGFGLGDVTLKDFLETHGLLPDLSPTESDLLMVYTDDSEHISSMSIASSLRALDVKVELQLGKIKFNKILKLAQKKGFNYVAIVERRDDQLIVQVKNIKENLTEKFNKEQTQEIKNYIL